jgi:serine phosphatase RsbU (regulator of sigma subunit)
MLAELGMRAALVVPMPAGGRSIGALSLVSAESGRRFRPADVELVEELARRAGTAVENARLYTERSAVARTLQASLLPERLPPLPGWRTAADYRAGQAGAEVGGDFYDVFRVDGAHMALLGDVTGKGVAAAALTSLVRHTAKTAAVFDARPSAVLAMVNKALRQRPRIAPVTMLCALLEDGAVTLAVGGHPPPLLKRSGRQCERVGRTGLLLGAIDEYPGAEEVTLRLEPGDTLLMFTDGVTDTPGEQGRFGEERLRAAVDAAPAEPGALLEAVEAALDEFAVGAGFDDRAMLAVQRA